VTGGAGPAQSFEDGQPSMPGEHPGDFLGLVEVTVLVALAVQRDGDQRPIPGERKGEPGIAKRLGSKSPEVTGKMEFAVVFQAVNHVQGAVIADQCGPGKLEGKFELMTIWAGKCGVDLPGK